jgi:hypothetical protein
MAFVVLNKYVFTFWRTARLLKTYNRAVIDNLAGTEYREKIRLRIKEEDRNAGTTTLSITNFDSLVLVKSVILDLWAI